MNEEVLKEVWVGAALVGSGAGVLFHAVVGYLQNILWRIVQIFHTFSDQVPFLLLGSKLLFSITKALSHECFLSIFFHSLEGIFSFPLLFFQVQAYFKLSYNLNHPNTGHHAQLKSCFFPCVCTHMHARASAQNVCGSRRTTCLSPSFLLPHGIEEQNSSCHLWEQVLYLLSHFGSTFFFFGVVFQVSYLRTPFLIQGNLALLYYPIRFSCEFYSQFLHSCFWFFLS